MRYQHNKQRRCGVDNPEDVEKSNLPKLIEILPTSPCKAQVEPIYVKRQYDTSSRMFTIRPYASANDAFVISRLEWNNHNGELK